MVHLLLADAEDLISWANRIDAQNMLPRLIRKLIHGTVPSVQRREFPAGEGVQLPGWDGTVAVVSGNAWVPDGVSAWELGVDKDVKGKADDDYEKRSKKPLGIDPKQATFVFVTARKWTKKKDWVATRKAEGIWRDVRAYDAYNIEEWLETAPAVHIWLSNQLGKRPDGIRDAETYWDNWSGATRPATSHDLVLAGRSATVTAIHSWLENPDSPLPLRADSSDEAVAVFNAAIRRLAPDRQADVLARTIIVLVSAAWSGVTLIGQSLIIVPKFECNSEELADAMSRGHAVVVTRGRTTKASPEIIEVPPISGKEAVKALIGMGLNEKRSRNLAMQARRSVMPIRRQLALVPDLEQPKWAHPENARPLVAALLAGRWSNASEGDRDALAKLAGTNYDTVEAAVVRWSNEDDPPVRCVAGVWYLTAVEDAWSLLARNVTLSDLKRFLEVVVGTLGTPDPAFDLPEDRRFMANLLGHGPRYSSHLKAGLSDSLAVIGARGGFLRTTGDVPLPDYAHACVRKLLDSDNWKVWASLSLSLLAEAAPEEFLDAVDRGLAGEKPTLANLFQGEGDHVFGSPLHTDLLWALERIAWSADYLVRVTQALGKLAQIDPGGRWSNRPQESLRTIFLPWLPQTSACLDGRIAALDRLRNLTPQVAWELMRALLPKDTDHSSNSSRPMWRDWAPEVDVRVSNTEYAKAIHELVLRMLEATHDCGERWCDLIRALPQLPSDEYDAVVAKLDSFDTAEVQTAVSGAIWNALRILISRHRSFRDADWSFPVAKLDRLADLLARLEPTDWLPRFGWLFSNSPALLEGREEDYETYERNLDSQQLSAVESLHASEGLQGVSRCVDSVERPDLLGAAVARSRIAGDVEDDLLSAHCRMQGDSHRRFVGGLVWEMVRQYGLEWARQKLTGTAAKWSPSHRASILVFLRFDSNTWALVEELDSATAAEYWRAVSPGHVSLGDAEQAAGHLLKHDRPLVALQLLEHHVRSGKISPTIVADALDAFVHSSPQQEGQRSLSANIVSELLAYVAGSPDVDESRIALLDWALLPALGRHHYSPKLLHRELARRPKFFVEVVSFAFFAKHGEPRQQSDQEQARATHAYELLHSWRWSPLPGMPENGDVDAKAIRDWVRETRVLLRAAHRLEVGDHTIGEVLSGSPADADGAWPHSVVRELVEEMQSDDFEQGIEIGKLNSEGVTFRGPNDVGARERKEAKQYDHWATAVSTRWGRTAALLRRLKDRYERRAREEDHRAELRDDLE